MVGCLLVAPDQILTRQHYMNDFNVNGTEFHSQRPIDVFTTMKANMFKQDGATTFTNTESSSGNPCVW